MKSSVQTNCLTDLFIFHSLVFHVKRFSSFKERYTIYTFYLIHFNLCFHEKFNFRYILFV
jgi:hypothetical protein